MKLKGVGVDGCYLKWFAGLLSNRWQYVEYRSAKSAPILVTSRVIQWFCVGPTLFNVFKSDLVPIVKYFKLLMFADDLKVVGDVFTLSLAALVHEDLSAIDKWSASSELPISLPKSSVMHYGTGNVRKTYTLNDLTFAAVDECTDRWCAAKQQLCLVTTFVLWRSHKFCLTGMVLKIFATRDMNFLHAHKACVGSMHFLCGRTLTSLPASC